MISMKNQVKKNLEKSDSSMDNDDNKYKCKKCKDVTYILTDKGAVPCSCKELREAERILSKSGISKEFANKTFDNFDYSRNVQILNAYNMAREYVKNFEEIKDLTPKQFVRNILKEKLNAKCVVCGFNYHFGKGGAGDANQLKNLCLDFGIKTRIIKPVLYKSGPISSSRIRKALEENDTISAQNMLSK